MGETWDLLLKTLSRLLAATVEKRNIKKLLKRSMPVNQEGLISITKFLEEIIALMLT